MKAEISGTALLLNTIRTMKTAAVVIDAWKLPTFKKHLAANRYEFTEHPGVTADTLTLRVKYEWVSDLQPVIIAADNECARLKLQ